MKSAVFKGQVSHSRRSPASHAFNYAVYMMYLDLSELDTVFEGRWLWSTRRAAIARFKRANYLGDPDISLDDAVRDLVAERVGSRPSGPIRVLTNLSCFGLCFNPISLYYCFDADDIDLEFVVAEVSNTPWGERHCYVLQNQGKDPSVLREESQKALHVSPFIDMNVDYEWMLKTPGKDLAVRISNRTNNDKFFTAALIMRREEISATTLAKTLLRFPAMTLRVVTAIYWQAVRLWAKGCPFQIHPKKQTQVPASK